MQNMVNKHKNELKVSREDTTTPSATSVVEVQKEVQSTASGGKTAQQKSNLKKFSSVCNEVHRA